MDFFWLSTPLLAEIIIRQVIFMSARTSYRAFDSRPVRPSAPIFPEFKDELKHCHQASGTPQIAYFIYFMKADDVSYLNSDKNTNTIQYPQN